MAIHIFNQLLSSNSQKLVEHRKCEKLAIIELVEYLLTKEDIEFVLLGLIQNDYLEGHFGWFCQLIGGNYYSSVLQLLQAEKMVSTEVSCRLWIQYVRN